jgi:hypothetical protein
MLATLCLLLGLPELVIRFVDPPLGQYRAIFFGSDPSSPYLFMTDPHLLWRLRPNVNLSFLDTRVSTDEHGFRKPVASNGERTAVVVGDSSAFGWLVEGKDTFANRLQQLLDQGAGPGAWRVVNAGVPGYTSFRRGRSWTICCPFSRPRC